MWDSAAERREAEALLRDLEEFLRRRGYHVSVSRVYPNRGNTGGRIYISVKRRTSRNMVEADLF